MLWQLAEIIYIYIYLIRFQNREEGDAQRHNGERKDFFKSMEEVHKQL